MYTIGHAEAAAEASESEPIHNGDNIYMVRPAEVLTAEEVIYLFGHYYDHHAVPAGWHLREQSEFATAAEPGATPADKPAPGICEGTQSSSVAAAQAGDATAEKAAVDKPESRRRTGAN